MDNSKAGSTKWGWLPAQMPGVARLLAEKRRTLGPAHVARCWEQGVVRMQPGWFFAREGPLAVGVPWPEVADICGWQVTPAQALVVLRDPEVPDGA